MPSVDFVISSPVVRSPRVMQLEGLFDLPPASRSERRVTAHLDLPDEWNVGAIVGPSGCGKTTIARHLFGEPASFDWPADRSVLDGFPRGLPIHEVVELLSSVGFSSPPAWLRPYHALSVGEQFRVDAARALAESRGVCFLDEFTSVVDRTTARVGSAALARTVRRRGTKLVAATCHDDVLEWLEPDWIYEPAHDRFTRRRLRRPSLALDVAAVDASAWELFRPHHYLASSLNGSARCFAAFWDERPAAFVAVLHQPHPRLDDLKREHRLVCLPGFQGIGIGLALSEYVAGICTALGYRYSSTTSHPGLIAARERSSCWRRTTTPTLQRAGQQTLVARGSGHWRVGEIRLTTRFVYGGEPVERALAESLWEAAHPSYREPAAHVGGKGASCPEGKRRRDLAQRSEFVPSNSKPRSRSRPQQRTARV